jgi:hypothetical protein
MKDLLNEPEEKTAIKIYYHFTSQSEEQKNIF